MKKVLPKGLFRGVRFAACAFITVNVYFPEKL
jgi:hypothetical protein